MRELTIDEMHVVSGGDFELDGLGAFGFGGFDGGFSAWYDANYTVDPVIVTSPLTMSQIAEANAYANRVAQWGVWGADTVLSVIGQIPGLGWPATVVGAGISLPPANSKITSGLSDAIFSSIVRAGGLKNYVYLQTFEPSL